MLLLVRFLQTDQFIGVLPRSQQVDIEKSAMLEISGVLTRVFKSLAVVLAVILLLQDTYEYCYLNPTIETSKTKRLTRELLPDIYICKDFTIEEAKILRKENIGSLQQLIFGLGFSKLKFFENYSNFFNLKAEKVLGIVAKFCADENIVLVLTRVYLFFYAVIWIIANILQQFPNRKYIYIQPKTRGKDTE